MAQVLIMYKQPPDHIAFDEYSFSTHVPICAETPGIRATSGCKGPNTPIAGDASPFLIATVAFDAMEAPQAGLASAPAQAAIADLPNFAGAGVDIVIYRTR